MASIHPPPIAPEAASGSSPIPIRPGIVLTTVASAAEGDRIARTLVAEQLAACISLSPIRSVYRWQGEVQQTAELQLVIKTDLNRFEALQERLLQLHSYDLPELIAFPIAQGSPAYLDWIAQQLPASLT